jgi:hypothetical protein
MGKMGRGVANWGLGVRSEKPRVSDWQLRVYNWRLLRKRRAAFTTEILAD